MGHLVSMPSLSVCVWVCVCVCVCVCARVCVCFPEVSEMVMPLTPMQGRLNSWYWLCEHLPLRIQTIQFYFNWGLQTEREEVPRLHVAHTHKHTHTHSHSGIHKHTAAHTLRLRVECVILQWYRLNRILTPLCWSLTETNALNITKAVCVCVCACVFRSVCVCVCVCVCMGVCVCVFFDCCFRCVALWIADTHGTTNVPLASTQIKIKQ